MRFKKYLKEYMRGQFATDRSAFVLVGLVVSLLVGMMVYSGVINSADTSNFSAGLNTTWAQAQTNSENGFNLLTVAIIVIAARAILSYMG